MADTLRTAVWKVYTGSDTGNAEGWALESPSGDESATSISLCGADVYTDSVSNPLRKPAGADGFSYVRWIRILLKNLTTTANTAVSNGKLYFAAGDLRNGAHIFFKVSSTYDGVLDDTYDLSANGGADITTADSSNKVDLTFVEDTANDVYKSHFIALQAKIDASVTWTGSISGAGTAPSIFVEYDEM